MDVTQVTNALTETLELIEDLEENYPSLWDKGEEFFESVRGSCSSMLTSLMMQDSATSGQYSAAKNWNAGVKKWHPDYTG